MTKALSYYIVFGIVCLIVFSFIYHQKTYSDELPHSQQIEKFRNGDYTLVYYLTTIPGYEAIVTAVIKAFELFGVTFSDTLNAARVVTLLILFLGLIPVFYNLSGMNLMRTVQFAFFSPVFTFLFLAYTDLMSMMFILIGYYYIQKKRYWLSGMIFGVSLLIRQNNIVWLGFAMAYIFFRYKLFVLRRMQFKTLIGFFLRIYWTFFVAIACFGIFVLVNGGMVLGTDRANHTAGIYVGNIWWLGFLLFFTQLPLMLGNAEKIWKYILKNKEVVGELIGISCLILALFTNRHIYNTYPGFIRNIILHWVFLSPMNIIAALIPMLYFVLYVLSDATKSIERLFWLFGIIVMLPSQLVDTRYCLVPIAFWMLSRSEQKKSIEQMQLCYSILISAIFLWGILNWKVFW